MSDFEPIYLAVFVGIFLGVTFAWIAFDPSAGYIVVLAALGIATSVTALMYMGAKKKEGGFYHITDDLKELHEYVMRI